MPLLHDLIKLPEGMAIWPYFFSGSCVVYQQRKEEGKERLNMKAVKKAWIVGAFVLLASLALAGSNGEKVMAAKKKSLSKAKITLSKKSYTYDGKKKKPAVTVKLGKKKVKKNIIP